VDPVAGNGSEPRRTVTSKVVAIIRSFGSGRSLTITEVAQAADLSLSTTHRLVHELAAWGILHRGGHARYEMVQPPDSYARRDRPVGLRTVAASTIEDLSAATTSDVRLGVIAGHQVLYVEKAYGGRPLSEFSAAATLPAHATAVGKALLAFSPPETVDHVIRHGLRSYTASTVATAARLRHALKVTRLRGIAVARGELLPGHAPSPCPSSGRQARSPRHWRCNCATSRPRCPPRFPHSWSRPAVSRGTWDGSPDRSRRPVCWCRPAGPSSGSCQRGRSPCRGWRIGSAGGVIAVDNGQPALRWAVRPAASDTVTTLARSGMTGDP
jgi:DNA-binding IclR family transcriptional regulator